MLNNITPIILSFNESENIGRCLENLTIFPNVIVIDSGSFDETLKIISNYSNAKVIHNNFVTFADQWNFAIQHHEIKTDWVLAIDSDYMIDATLINELKEIDFEKYGAYSVDFKYMVNRKILKASLYPPVTVLINKKKCHYINDGHCMRAVIDGMVGRLKNKILHDDRKPFSRWLDAANKYANQEAALLHSKKWVSLKIQDKLRRLIIITPWLVPVYYLTVKRGILDKSAGLIYAYQRGLAELILMIKLIEIKK